MAKHVSCRDLGASCEFVAEGTTDDEVLAKLAAHAKAEHGATEVSPEMAQMVKSKIH